MTDHGAVAAERMVAHRGERCFRLIRRQHAHDFTLIGEIERIKPQNLAKAPHLVAQRCALFMYEDADLRRFGDLVEYRCDAATSRVPGAAASKLSISPCKAAQSLSIGADSAMSPRHRQAVAMHGQFGKAEARLVLHRRQQVVIECCDENILDEIPHRLAAAAVGHRDPGDMNVSQSPPVRGRTWHWLDDVHELFAAAMASPLT